MKIQIVKGSIGQHWDKILVEIDGKKKYCSYISLGNRHYTVGEEIYGIMIGDEFIVAEEYLQERKEIEKMIYRLFRLCDKYVELKHSVEFEDECSKVVKKFGHDLHQIYYGKTYEEMKAKYSRYDILEPKKKKAGHAKIKK